MTPSLLSLFVVLSKDNAVLHCTRDRKGTLTGLYPYADMPEGYELHKGCTWQLFTPNETEQAFIDLAMPKVLPKSDPMADRLKKSTVEKPVQYVLRQVRENPDLDRKALIALCVSMGIADYTARTQVQVGLKRRRELAELTAKVQDEQTEQDEENQE